VQASSQASWHTRGVDDRKSDEPGSLLVAPPPHPRDNWFEIIEAGAVGGFTGAFGNDAYNLVKSAFQAAVKKFRDQRPDPDEEAEWVPGSMATYEHFIYGPIRDALDAVACDLTQAGYLVPDPPTISAKCDEDECPGCDLHWLLMAYGSVEKAFADDGRDDIDQTCAAHGATYDGGGMYVE
jgi:hypothetical protein